MDTLKSNKIHIGILGRTNSGKSSLLNAITKEDTSIVSPIEGTTTDLVYKPMEVPNLGQALFIDTPGYGDTSILGEKRQEKLDQALKSLDIGLILLSGNKKEDEEFIEKIKDYKFEKIFILSKGDLDYKDEYFAYVKKYKPIKVSINNPKSIEELLDKVTSIEIDKEITPTQGLVKKGDTVVLVMPMDIQAPKGRLIQPQVQTIRDILDKEAIAVSTGLDNLEKTLENLNYKVDLFITDSQIFDKVYEKSSNIPLTSFSVLMSKVKGDIDYFIKSAYVMDNLSLNSKFLICEGCSHVPQDEDIGTVQIPNMLYKKFGRDISIDFARGNSFPIDSSHDLVIHCGDCMNNRKHLLSRVNEAKEKNIPMTNYGIFIAYIKGILEKIVY